MAGQWKAGRRRPPTARTDKIPPRLALLRDGVEDRVHIRWQPQLDAPADVSGAAEASVTAPSAVCGGRVECARGLSNRRGTLTIEWIDTDAAGIYHNSTVTRLVEAAEAALVRERGLDGYFPVAPRVRFEADFEAPLCFGQDVDDRRRAGRARAGRR